MQVNIHQAKTHFSKLIARACRGEDVVVAKAGRPVIRLVPATRPSRPRRPGSAKGQIVVGKDFDKPLPRSLLRKFGLA